MQVNLALCCKARLPVLYKGNVSARLDKLDGGSHLSQFTQILSQQPNGVSHLKLFSAGWPLPQPNYGSHVGPTGNCRDTRDLIDLRYAQSRPCRHDPGCCMGMALLCQCQTQRVSKQYQCGCLLTQSAVKAAQAVPGQCCIVPAGSAASRDAATVSPHREQPPEGQRRWLPGRELECPGGAVSS